MTVDSIVSLPATTLPHSETSGDTAGRAEYHRGRVRAQPLQAPSNTIHYNMLESSRRGALHDTMRRHAGMTNANTTSHATRRFIPP
jgi:hypothetical protein